MIAFLSRWATQNVAFGQNPIASYHVVATLGYVIITEREEFEAMLIAIMLTAAMLTVLQDTTGRFSVNLAKLTVNLDLTETPTAYTKCIRQLYYSRTEKLVNRK